jgi:hypothetical protein
MFAQFFDFISLLSVIVKFIGVFLAKTFFEILFRLKGEICITSGRHQPQSAGVNAIR